MAAEFELCHHLLQRLFTTVTCPSHGAYSFTTMKFKEEQKFENITHARRQAPVAFPHGQTGRLEGWIRARHLSGPNTRALKLMLQTEYEYEL